MKWGERFPLRYQEGRGIVLHGAKHGWIMGLHLQLPKVGSSAHTTRNGKEKNELSAEDRNETNELWRLEIGQVNNSKKKKIISIAELRSSLLKRLSDSFVSNGFIGQDEESGSRVNRIAEGWPCFARRF